MAISSSPDPFAVIDSEAVTQVSQLDDDLQVRIEQRRAEREALALQETSASDQGEGDRPQTPENVDGGPSIDITATVTDPDEEGNVAANLDVSDSGGVFNDILNGIVAGAANAVENTAETGALAINGLGGEIDTGEGAFDFFDAPTPDSVAGRITEGVVRFGIGFVGVGKFVKAAQLGLKGVNFLSKTFNSVFASTSVVAQIGKSAVQGGVGDFIVSNAIEGRLSDLVQEYPSLENPITEYLASDPEDSTSLGKLKAGLEGFIIGGVAETTIRGVIEVVKGVKTSRLARASGKTAEEVDQAILKSAEAAEKLFIKPNPNTVQIAPTAGKVGDEAAAPVTKAGQVAVDKKLINHEDLVALRAAAAKAVDDGGAEFDELANAIPFNTETWKTGKSYLEVVDELSAILATRTDDAVEHLDDVDALAVALAQDPAKLIDDLHVDAEAIEGLGARIVAAKYTMHSLGKSTIEAASQMEVLAKAGQLTEDLVDRWNRTALMWADFHITSKQVIRGTSRAEGSGRIRTGAGLDIDPDNIADAIKNIKGDPLVAISKIAAMNNPGLVARAFKIMFKNKVWDIHNELLVNGMLSGVKTFEINFFSTGLNTFVFRPFERGIAARIEGRSGIGEVAALYTGMFRGFLDSIKMTAKALRKEDAILDPLQGTNELRKTIAIGDGKVSFDNFRQFGGVGGMMANGVNAIGQVVRLPTRLLLTADEFFKQSAYRMDISSQLAREATDQGLKGLEVSRYIGDNFQSRVLEGLDPITGKAKNIEALDFSRDVSFTQDLDRWITPGQRGTVGASVQRFMIDHPGLRFIAPFIRTPVNLMRFVWQRTPLIGRHQHQMKADIAAGGKRAAQAKAKIATGYTMYMMGTLLASGGYITGSGPKNPSLKAQWGKDGKIPYAVKRHFADGTSGWVQMNRLDPVAMPMFMIADLMQAVDDPSVGDQGQFEEIATGIFIALTKNLNAKSYLKGLTDLMDTVASEEDWKWSRFIGQQAQIRIPFNGLLRNMNPDETLREARTVVDSILNGLPGYSEDLPAKRDAIGETRLRVSSQSYTPFPSTHDSDDPLDLEFARLAEQGQRIGNPNRVQKGVNTDEFPGFYSEWQKRVSEMTIGRGRNARTLRQRLTALVTSDKYKALGQDVTAADGTPLTVSLIRAEIEDFRNDAFEDLIYGKDTKSKFKNADGVTMAKAVETASLQSRGLSGGVSMDDIKKLFNLN